MENEQLLKELILINECFEGDNYTLQNISQFTISSNAYLSEWDDEVYVNNEDFRDAYPIGTRGSDCFVKGVALFDCSGYCVWFNKNRKVTKALEDILATVDSIITIFKNNNQQDLVKMPLNDLISHFGK